MKTIYDGLSEPQVMPARFAMVLEDKVQATLQIQNHSGGKETSWLRPTFLELYRSLINSLYVPNKSLQIP